MKIKSIRIYKLRIKLREPFIISLGRLEYADNVVVEIETASGIRGFGECSPFMTINGENADTGLVVARHLASVLIGKNPLEIGMCVNLMDTVIYGNTSIKSAFDIALHDIAAQHSGLPLYAYLGGNNKKILFTDYTVSLNEKSKMTDDAIKIKENGFPVIKVKLGGPKDKDIERIQEIRKAIGMEIPLRIDANQGWNIESAVHVLNELGPFNIQFCEEPIPRWNFMELPRLRCNSPIKIMADESCLDHHDAERLITLNACDAFNVKLGKSSGIHKAMKIIGLAEKAGLKMQVGGFLESRIGFTASAHVALASESIVYCDFDSPLMFSEDPVTGGIEYQKGGMVKITEEPGLGAAMDENYLKGLNGIVIS